MASLQLFLFGAPRCELNGEVTHLRRRKSIALLSYLAVEGQRHQRDTLATLLWPESSQRSARKALRRDLSELNLALGVEWLDVTRESVGLRDGFGLDIAEFQRLLVPDHVDTDGLATAAALYRDDFLKGFMEMNLMFIEH